MLRAGGALSHGHGAVEAIRARRRQQEWALRKARRETQLVSKRLLRELQDDGEEMETREPSVTQEEVLQLYQRIQRGSEDRLAALQSLCQLLHLAEAQKMFVRLENSIHVLIGLFTSNLASVQLKAAQCLLRLSHADDPIVSLVCLPATPYLLTYLSGQSAKFTEQCLYILGNLAAENEAVRNQLLLQGVVHALAGCLQSPHGAVVEAAAYSLSQLLQAKEAREKIVPYKRALSTESFLQSFHHLWKLLLLFINMRTKVVPMKVKEAIMRLRNKNKTVGDISQNLGLPKSTVWSIIKKKESTGELTNRKGTGRPRKTSTADDRRILSVIKKNPQTPAQQIRNTLQESGVDLSMTTVCRRLHEEESKGYTARCKPLVSCKNRMAWLHFAKKYSKEQTQFCKKVLWTDETKIN
ncbi:transmembrane and coiled-coil domain-containing protein 6 isoform X2 [Rhinoraja longicauda]